MSRGRAPARDQQEQRAAAGPEGTQSRLGRSCSAQRTMVLRRRHPLPSPLASSLQHDSTHKRTEACRRHPARRRCCAGRRDASLEAAEETGGDKGQPATGRHGFLACLTFCPFSLLLLFFAQQENSLNPCHLSLERRSKDASMTSTSTLSHADSHADSLACSLARQLNCFCKHRSHRCSRAVTQPFYFSPHAGRVPARQSFTSKPLGPFLFLNTHPFFCPGYPFFALSSSSSNKTGLRLSNSLHHHTNFQTLLSATPPPKDTLPLFPDLFFTQPDQQCLPTPPCSPLCSSPPRRRPASTPSSTSDPSATTLTPPSPSSRTCPRSSASSTPRARSRPRPSPRTSDPSGLATTETLEDSLSVSLHSCLAIDAFPSRKYHASTENWRWLTGLFSFALFLVLPPAPRVLFTPQPSPWLSDEELSLPAGPTWDA